MTGLPDLASAVEWCRDHWDEQRPVPTRLHVQATGDDGAPRMSGAFASFLVRSDPPEKGETPTDLTLTSTREEVPCPLRLLPDCARCGGIGYTVHDVVTYAWPMSAALYRLQRVPATSRGWPTPYVMIVQLASHGWHVPAAAAAIGQPVLGPDHYKTVEAAFLLAIRKLYGRYASAPMPAPARPSWVDMSESQRNAEGGTAA